MTGNPYQPPLESSPPTRAGRATRAGWLTPWLVILVISYLIASIVTPADPFSSLLAMIPLFTAMAISRWFGVRAGRREVEARIAQESDDDRVNAPG